MSSRQLAQIKLSSITRRAMSSSLRFIEWVALCSGRRQLMTCILRSIGSNLGDPSEPLAKLLAYTEFRGITAFRGKPRSRQIHPDDLESVMARAKKAGVVQQILTGDNMSKSKETIELAHQYSKRYCSAVLNVFDEPLPELKTTAGLHPCMLLDPLFSHEV